MLIVGRARTVCTANLSERIVFTKAVRAHGVMVGARPYSASRTLLERCEAAIRRTRVQASASKQNAARRRRHERC